MGVEVEVMQIEAWVGMEWSRMSFMQLFCLFFPGETQKTQ